MSGRWRGSLAGTAGIGFPCLSWVRRGESVRRRLMALGFHKGDVVELDGQAILRGPLLVRNCTSDTTVALGRGVAQKVLVEPVHEPS